MVLLYWVTVAGHADPTGHWGDQAGTQERSFSARKVPAVGLCSVMERSGQQGTGEMGQKGGAGEGGFRVKKEKKPRGGFKHRYKRMTAALLRTDCMGWRMRMEIRRASTMRGDGGSYRMVAGRWEWRAVVRLWALF